ncbi:MAG: DUF4307 domain-containing protein [Corynebacteriales bacterium]|nr:DUF4307 domain-containing protein [Mycobacteriales bacterium]
MSASKFPPGRYGRRRARRQTPKWLLPTLITAVILAGFGASWRLYDTYQGDKIESQVTHFRWDEQQSAISIKFQVVKDAGEPATCTVRARNAAGQEVGHARVPIPAGQSGQRSVVVTYTLPTDGEAVTGEVFGCTPGHQ